MNKLPLIARLCLPGIAAAILTSPALAAQPSAPASAEAAYQKERAACLAGSSQQDRATCLKEAGAALAEARRARLGNAEDARALADNALRRCKAVAPEDRDDCERMARGEGKVSGSVEGGGVIKELVTRSVEPVPTPPAPAASR